MNVIKHLELGFGLFIHVAPDKLSLQLDRYGLQKDGQPFKVREMLDKYQVNELINELNGLRTEMEYQKDDPKDIDDEQYGEGPDYPY